MNIIELKIRFSCYTDWKQCDDGVLRSTRIEENELNHIYNLDSEDSEEQKQIVINALRRADQDFNKEKGARDKNLRYEITEIVFDNGFASGRITREALDNKLGYQPLYPKS